MTLNCKCSCRDLVLHDGESALPILMGTYRLPSPPAIREKSRNPSPALKIIVGYNGVDVERGVYE
jgi:hypothetical protein